MKMIYTTYRRFLVAFLLIPLVFSPLLPAVSGPVSAAAGGRTERVSISSSGEQGNFYSNSPHISADGRFVAFQSAASNLVSGDTNGFMDTFVHDRQTGITERVSVSSGGEQGNYSSNVSDISADGRYVTFRSYASNLVSGDMNGASDVFIHDRQTGITERVSVSSSGEQGNSDSYSSSISADGRFVAFDSGASNLVSGDTNGTGDTFIHDRQTGITERVSVSSSGEQGNSVSYVAGISADGRFVAFVSIASNLVSEDTSRIIDIFVHDRQTGITERISVSSSGDGGNDHSDFSSISADGRFVAFQSVASNLVSGDTNDTWDAFVHDRQTGITERVSVSSSGEQGNSASYIPDISADGRFVAFVSYASNLVSGDTNGEFDIFVRDRQTGVIERVSVSSSGEGGNEDVNSPHISADGRFVAFDSYASNLVSGDTNGTWDIFVHDRCPGGICPVLGQDSIRGRIVSQDGMPLPGVSVATLAGYQAVTGPDGVYTLENIPGGVYMLRPSLPGYSFIPEWRAAVPAAPAFSMAYQTAAGEQSTDFIAVADGGPVAPFLDLPIDFNPMTFSEIIQDTGDGGKIGSWFDHKYPNYSSDPGIWTYKEIVETEKRYCGNPIDNVAGYGKYCYDGHDGYDFNGVPKDTEILAAGDGEMVSVLWDEDGFGRYVVLDHHNGYLTLYGQLSEAETSLLHTEVSRGTKIGVIGDTGNSSGTHLHFGVYRDSNNNHRFDYGIDRPVDPFGWYFPKKANVPQDDPWAKPGWTVSRNLWVENQPPLTQEPSLTNHTGSITVTNNMEGEGFWSILEGIATGLFSSRHRIVGLPFRIDILEWRWPGGNMSFLDAAAQGDLFQFSIEYLDEEIRHLDESRLVLYQADANGELQPLPTQVDAAANIVTATSSSPGDFSLQGPLLCPDDLAEVNDWPAAAGEISPSASPLSAVFDIPGDEDWYVFQAQAGGKYAFEADDRVEGVRLSLQLFDEDQTTLLAETTDGAPLVWKATENTALYLRAANTPEGISGCNATYHLSVNSPSSSQVFLPFTTR